MLEEGRLREFESGGIQTTGGRGGNLGVTISQVGNAYHKWLLDCETALFSTPRFWMSGNGRPSPVLRIIGTPRGQSYWAPGQVSAEEEDAQAAPDPRRRKYVRRRMQEQTGGESGHRGAREDAAAEGKGPRASVDVQLHEDDLVEAPRNRGEKE